MDCFSNLSAIKPNKANWISQDSDQLMLRGWWNGTFAYSWNFSFRPQRPPLLPYTMLILCGVAMASLAEAKSLSKPKSLAETESLSKPESLSGPNNLIVYLEFFLEFLRVQQSHQIQIWVHLPNLSLSEPKSLAKPNNPIVYTCNLFQSQWSCDCNAWLMIHKMCLIKLGSGG